MKWDGDEYKDLKWMIFDNIKEYLKEDHSMKITVRRATTLIDDMFERLLIETDYKNK